MSQTRDNGGWSQGDSSRAGDNWLDSGHSLKESTGLDDNSDVWLEKRGQSSITPSVGLSNC